ncbi:hypothetical protein D8Y22_03455 [Salinadaptatus halalkaliphilus]|uniref:Histidine kinase n=1 Tax=Salinadaptatus halalkaliphilus TaxID=2419781 RepID=A0A4S3TUJ1_9EURY|nr:hypothetical protein [Salinadaptatus halalkaliphilus]THE66338.1 hypothetical protein D8Y22_03455 [Salinadaptatus halalkaliphilus]
MGTDTENTSAFGIDSTWGWPIGGALGGALGAAAFGLVVWFADPDIVAVAIPAVYGLDPVGVVGWGIHIAHGIVLGLIFGFLVTRSRIHGIIRTSAETDALSQTSVALRVIAAGFVFGLAIWALLPLIVLPVWIEAIGTQAAADFPAAAVESLAGHVLFGIVLGLVFAVLMDLETRPAHSPLEEEDGR